MAAAKRSKKSTTPNHKAHHELPKSALLLPGAFLLFATFLLIAGQESWSFLFVGIAIVIAVMIHKEEE